MSLIGSMFPQWALNRAKAKQQLDSLRLLEHDKTNARHPRRKMGPQSGDAVMQYSRHKPRESARWLEENHPIAVSILDTITSNVIGEGTMVEPMVMTPSGELATETNQALRKAYRDFMKAPEVTGELCGCEFEEMIVRSHARDGEVFAQHVRDGAVIRWPDPTMRYLVELIEADLVPFDHHGVDGSFTHGVEKNAWGRPINYAVFKAHPGDTLAGRRAGIGETKIVSADLMLHFKNTKRIRQTRGISMMASIIDLLLDLSHYEDAERVAARINATQTITIEQAFPNPGDENAATGEREFNIGPANVWHLAKGEKASMFAPDRPNVNLDAFVQGQIRRAAGAVKSSASTISRNYEGSYSSQRQELVESFRFYKQMRRRYYENVLENFYREVVIAAIDRRDIPVTGIDRETLFDADYRGPGMVWIDPQKEAKANEMLVDNGFESRQGVIRDKGGDPWRITREINEDEFKKAQPIGMQPDERRDPNIGNGDGSGDGTEEEEASSEEAAA